MCERPVARIRVVLVSVGGATTRIRVSFVRAKADKSY